MNAAPPLPIADPSPTRNEAVPDARASGLESLIWAALVCGVGLRLWHYLGGRSLWVDEAMVVLNLRHLSAQELLGKLYYDQLAPLGWLQLEKLFEGLPGSPEFALRAPALLASIGAIFLFRSLARRVLEPHGVLAAMILFAFSPQLIRYAAEVKPYAFDVLFSVAILTVGVEMLRRRETSLGLLAAFAGVGAGAVVFSFSAVFVLAGAGLTVVAHRAILKRPWETAALVLIAAIWLGAFAALYRAVYQPQFAGGALTTGVTHDYFLRTSYAPFPPQSASDLTWYVRWAGRTIEFFFGRDSRIVVSLLVCMGALALVRRSPWAAAAVLLTFPIAVAASGVHAYPLYRRLVLFLLPPVILLAATGIEMISGRGRPRLLVWGVLVVLASVGGGVKLAHKLAARPVFAQEQVRPMLRILQRERRPGDGLYVDRRAAPAFLVYRNDYDLARAPWMLGHTLSIQWPCVLADIPAAPAGRTWLLVYKVPRPPAPEELSGLLAARGSAGELKLRARSTGAFLYSLELSAPLAGDGPSAVPAWRSRCASLLRQTPNPPPGVKRSVQ